MNRREMRAERVHKSVFAQLRQLEARGAERRTIFATWLSIFLSEVLAAGWTREQFLEYSGELYDKLSATRKEGLS